MKKFGHIRLLREDIGFLRGLYFRVAGVSPDHKLRFMYLKRLLKGGVSEKQIKNILDAGCGGGDYSFYFSERFPESNIFSIDIAEDKIMRNRRLQKTAGITNIEFKKKDITSLDCVERYDLICCIDVLEHIRYQKKALQCLYTALKSDGYLFVHAPLKRLRRVIFDKYLTHFHEWANEEHVAEPHTKDSFLDLLSECGYEIVHWQTSFNHYLGELCVSLIMLFYKETIIHQFVRALFTPFMAALIYLDIALENKSGNAIAVLLKKS